uniref:Uncharacterized protein n=1 Tax=Cacopsylla melanoneura TaxID=428564 RepID=A0A8D9A9Q7_9HEMI
MNDSNVQNKKDRNQKRMRDKYKNKKPSAQLIKLKSEKRAEAEKEKAKVPNNWDRYEEDLDTHEDIETSVTNFNTLSSNVTERNFFQFKHEKKWLEEIKHCSTQVPEDNSFHLNLNLMKSAIGLVPLSDRCGIPRDLFTESELEELENDCIPYAEQYDKLLKELNGESHTNPTRRNEEKTPNLSNLRISGPKIDEAIEDVKPNSLSGDLAKPNSQPPGELSKNNRLDPNSIKSVDKSKETGTHVGDSKVTETGSDSDDDELDFLLNLPTDVKVLKKQDGLPMKASASQDGLPMNIEDKVPPSSDDLDMDMLDSLLS